MKLYENLTYEEYTKLDGLRNSDMGHIERSPAHYLEALAHPKPPTKSMLLGTKLHLAVLEPKQYAIEYPEPDPVVSAMRDSLLSHTAAFFYLQQVEQTEVSVVWDSIELGCKCKARLDAICRIKDPKVVLDIKTTKDASPDAFSKAIYNYGYYRGGSHYLEAAREAFGGEWKHFVILAVENEPPHAVAVYRMSDDAIAAGTQKRRDIAATYRRCVLEGRYPAYSNQVQEITLPRWAWSSIPTAEEFRNGGIDFESEFTGKD